VIVSSDPVDHRDAELAWLDLQDSLTRPPTLINAGAMLAAAQSKPLFLVDQMIPAGAITLMVGIPGAKKSWLAYSLALATARGGEWLGKTVTPWGEEPEGCETVGAPVLVLNFDNPTPECGRRFKRLGMTPDDPIHFHSVEIDPLRLPKSAESLRAIVSHVRPALVVVDSLRQAHDSDENSSSDMAVVMGALKQLYVGNAAVVIVHHATSNADGNTKARGSGEILASADAQITVSYDVDEECDNALWAKHRSWEITDEEASVDFELVDEGESTILRLH
jgi:RecA-family ATPase